MRGRVAWDGEVLKPIAVRKLPSDPGPAAWNAILPPQEPPVSLAGSRHADWIIIGGGFAGLSAARRLRQLRPEDRIVVLEARRIAQGPAGRNSGFMIDLPHDLASEDYGGAADTDKRQIAQNRAAIGFAADMAHDYGLSREAFDPCGKINAAATERGLAHTQHYGDHLAALGERSERLDAAAMQAITGTDYYLGGLRTPGAVLLQPALYMRGIAAGLIGQDIAIHENSPVTGLERTGDTWRATTPEGDVSAPAVILAVNGHANSFGFYERQLIHTYTYGAMTRAMTPDEAGRLGGEARWAMTPADPMGTTVRRISGTGGDRLIVRNRFTIDPGLAVDEARLGSVWRGLDRAFAARFPMLGDMTMEHRWGGALCVSWNSVPAFGEVEPRLYSAVCQNGLGTVKGTLAGMMAAELACGSGSNLLADFIDQPAPRRLPPSLLTRIGGTARIRWQEWRAGRDF